MEETGHFVRHGFSGWSTPAIDWHQRSLQQSVRQITHLELLSNISLRWSIKLSTMTVITKHSLTDKRARMQIYYDCVSLRFSGEYALFLMHILSSVDKSHIRVKYGLGILHEDIYYTEDTWYIFCFCHVCPNMSTFLQRLGWHELQILGGIKVVPYWEYGLGYSPNMTHDITLLISSYLDHMLKYWGNNISGLWTLQLLEFVWFGASECFLAHPQSTTYCKTMNNNCGVTDIFYIRHK